MKKILFSGAILFFLAWVIGFFILGAGVLIHALAALALIFWMQGIISKPRQKSQE
jgi:hypothetical protein